MTDLLQNVQRLGQFETQSIVPLQTFAPGTYTQRLLTEGNSILSSLFVRDLDPGTTVKVNYYDYGVGTEYGERYDLTGHDLVSVPTIPTPNRVLVTKLHNKPVIEIIVTGGNASLGIYITVVASFASDLDSALKRDNTIADLLVDKGIPIITYDQDNGKFFILRSQAGVIPVAFSEAGTSIHLPASGVTTPGIPQTLIDVTVPAGVTRKLSQAVVVCRSHGTYKVTSDGVIIASGRTGPASPKDVFPWNPRRDVPTGKDVKIIFTADASSPVSDVEAYVMASDV